MLHLHKLSYHREIADLLHVLKYNKGCYDEYWYNYIEVLFNSSLRSGNVSLVLSMKVIKIECLKKSFFNRVVPLWNALPQQLSDADFLYCFKRKFVMHYDNYVTAFDTCR